MLDIFAYKTEDYLDDIVALTEEESVSLDVRIAHNLMEKWTHYIKPAPPPPKQRKKSKKYKMKKAHASMISIAEISLGQDKASSTNTIVSPSQGIVSKAMSKQSVGEVASTSNFVTTEKQTVNRLDIAVTNID